MNTANTGFATVIQTELDKQVREGATSGFMEDNAGKVIYHGGKEVKLPTISLKGLADYDRDEGYSDGAVTFAYQTVQLSKDRGRRFRLDSVDVNEESFSVVAATIAEEFQRTKVIPEIDAYRYSKLSDLAGIKHYGDSLTASNVFGKLTAQLSEVLEETGGEGDLVIVISRQAYNTLMASSEVQKTLDVGSFVQGEISTEVKTFNGAAIIPVPAARMKSAYTFNNDDNGGFTPEEGALDINWIILPKDAAVAISKTDNVKIITPEQNQFADAWDVDYRKYHDIFLPESRVDSVAVSFVQTEPTV
jgi:hypothetical protein